MYISLDNTIKNLEAIYRLYFNEWLTADYGAISENSATLFDELEDKFTGLIYSLISDKDQFLRDDDGA